jgi:hypothetical protein
MGPADRLTDCLDRGDPGDADLIAWQCYQQVRIAYAAQTPAAGEAIAEQILASFPRHPVREISRLGRTLRQWKHQYLGYFTTGGANNGGTEATASSNPTEKSHRPRSEDIRAARPAQNTMPTLRIEAQALQGDELLAATRAASSSVNSRDG